MAVIGWIDAFHDERQSGTTSTVEIRSAKLYACFGGSRQLLADGIVRMDGTVTGGIVTKTPWWGATAETFTNSYASGIVTFHPNERPTRIWHAWNSLWPRASIPAGATSVFFVVEVRVSGPAWFRAGIDYWVAPDDTTTNLEAGASDWIQASQDWQTIVVGSSCP